MFSLRPKEGGSAVPPPTPPPSNILLKVGMVLSLILILAVGYVSYSTRTELERQIAGLQEELADQARAMKAARTQAADMAADIDLVRKRTGVTAQELESARKFAERLRAEQEKAKEQLASELASKANSTAVAAARQEASTKLAEVQQSSEAKIGTFSGAVKTVAANLDVIRTAFAGTSAHPRTRLLPPNGPRSGPSRKKIPDFGCGDLRTDPEFPRSLYSLWPVIAVATIKAAAPISKTSQGIQ